MFMTDNLLISIHLCLVHYTEIISHWFRTVHFQASIRSLICKCILSNYYYYFNVWYVDKFINHNFIFFILPYRGIGSNPLYCDCSLQWLAEWIKKDFIESGIARCAEPSSMKDKLLLSTPASSFVCKGRYIGSIRSVQLDFYWQYIFM